jgi:hypothetical protein
VENEINLLAMLRLFCSRRFSVATAATPSQWMKQASTIGKKYQLFLPQGTTGDHQGSNIALIVGWAGSNHKALKKYSTIYTELGIPTMTVVYSMTDMWSSHLSSIVANNLLKGLPDKCNVLLHLFSFGASVVLPTFTSAAVLNPDVKIKGVIFDSGPSEFSYESGVNAAKNLWRQGYLNIVTYGLANAVGITVNKLVGKKRRLELNNAMMGPLLDGIPQLYICSKLDTVCPVDRVDAIVQQQRGLGRSVVMKVFDDAEHVKILLKYPEEYKELVVTFLKQIKLD